MVAATTSPRTRRARRGFPTTAGDVGRRWDQGGVPTLPDAIREVRVGVWTGPPRSFLDEAILDGAGVTAPTTGPREEGMDISRQGGWGRHPFLVSSADTGEPPFIMNRSGHRPSREGAAD